MLADRKPQFRATSFWAVCVRRVFAGRIESIRRKRGWCDDQTIVRDTESFLSIGQKLDVPILTKWLAPEIEAKWKRKEFKAFSRITVPLSPLSLGILYALVLLTTGGICVWTVRNKYGEGVTKAVFFGKRARRSVVFSILLVCLGVGLSTITDPNVGSNSVGFLVGLGAILSTAAYQIWAGSKQKVQDVL